eukprot:CAMPEP_0175015350 /NCGR_PEP_ID=MMETSP0005-20121125/11120_1 /TAXON_ID=420556 /ORGANISM="Ochromonas sp., Strain CCMP1393" /LENGTH=457 /DNA_ID=CAMNT_0016272297 /DNA_START=16 /DNA_END=1389 /DNA_ORIENTATION=+
MSLNDVNASRHPIPGISEADTKDNDEARESASPNDMYDEEILTTMTNAALIELLEDQGINLGDDLYSKHELVEFVKNVVEQDFNNMSLNDVNASRHPIPGTSEAGTKENQTSNVEAGNLSSSTHQELNPFARRELPDNATVLELIKEQIRSDLAPFIMILDFIVPKPVKIIILKESKIIFSAFRASVVGATLPLVHGASKMVRVSAFVLREMSDTLDHFGHGKTNETSAETQQQHAVKGPLSVVGVPITETTTRLIRGAAKLVRNVVVFLDGVGDALDGVGGLKTSPKNRPIAESTTKANRGFGQDRIDSSASSGRSSSHSVAQPGTDAIDTAIDTATATTTATPPSATAGSKDTDTVDSVDQKVHVDPMEVEGGINTYVVTDISGPEISTTTAASSTIPIRIIQLTTGSTSETTKSNANAKKDAGTNSNSHQSKRNDHVGNVVTEEDDRYGEIIEI